MFGTQRGQLYPAFFWQHGEDHEALLEEIEAIKASGAREFCVESRVYEHFCEDAWWEDFGFILDAARQRDMKVWLLDDKRFPTGFANDILGKKYPHLRKRCIRETHRDFLGPLPGGTIPSYDRYRTEGERLMGVYAYRRSGEGEALCGDPIDLTGRLEDGLSAGTSRKGSGGSSGWWIPTIPPTATGIISTCCTPIPAG